MNESPLRYPGGKYRIAPIIRHIIEASGKNIDTYYEPFCGGAGVALYLLMNNVVENIAINDFDRAIYSIWRAVFYEPDELTDKIRATPITVQEWYKQKEIYLSSNKYSIAYAFASLFLNRTNRSGIISAGPIGGYKQDGVWKIDARFNKKEIIRRIEQLSQYRKRVTVNNMDIRRYMKVKEFNENSFIYFDPPYVNNAKRLYKNSLTFNDHTEIASLIKEIGTTNWVITYDDTELIRSLYSDYHVFSFPIQYSAATKKKELELLILPQTYVASDLKMASI